MSAYQYPIPSKSVVGWASPTKNLEPQNVSGNLVGFILALYAFRSVTAERSRANSSRVGIAHQKSGTAKRPWQPRRVHPRALCLSFSDR
jgi:hypothetical protein